MRGSQQKKRRGLRTGTLQYWEAGETKRNNQSVLKMNGSCGHRRLVVKRLHWLQHVKQTGKEQEFIWKTRVGSCEPAEQAWDLGLLKDFCLTQCPSWASTKLPTRMAKASFSNSSLHLRGQSEHAALFCINTTLRFLTFTFS